MTDTVEAIVIGAGVIGLACARAIAHTGREVILIEDQPTFGTGVSSRNSEVIHAGIYYPAGSLKAQLCVRGKQLLYEFCNDHQVPHRRTGKLIVASSNDQLASLRTIQDKAIANGVHGLRVLSGEEVRELEPPLSVAGALLSPSTGIIDSHALMVGLLGDAERHGAVLAVDSPAIDIEVKAKGIRVRAGRNETIELHSDWVINAAGLQAIDVAKKIRGLPKRCIPSAYYAKGNYFSCSQSVSFNHLIYPLPEPGGLGVHLTLDLAGQARFGPDVEWVETLDYQVNANRGGKFYGAIRRYWPTLKDGALQPAYAGIRPKIVGPGEGDADFVIQTERVHGVRGLVNLFGIESPGLTSSLAIAEYVVADLESHG